MGYQCECITACILHYYIPLTQAKLLVHSVDAITDPPTSTVDYLAISAKSGDPQLFADQVNNIHNLTTTLQEIAHNATMG